MFYLQRYLNAQDFGNVEYGTESYATALQEIKDGHKKTHWMWYVFPQMKGLGKSEMSSFYGINGREEAIAYMEHPILSKRLIEATEAVLNNPKSAYEIFGYDVIKLTRLSFAGLKVSNLKSGEYRKLTIKEVQKLYSLVK